MRARERSHTSRRHAQETPRKQASKRNALRRADARALLFCDASTEDRARSARGALRRSFRILWTTRTHLILE
jgi:hypothetical protein